MPATQKVEAPRITDHQDQPLKVGDKVIPYGVSEEVGEVASFVELDEGRGWQVEALWADGDVDFCSTCPPDWKKAWAGDQTLRCDDLERVS